MADLFSNNQDIFRTQADTRFNSFADSMNGVNQNQGNGQWGINSNYLTPSYLSPFRPQYQGPGGNSYQGNQPSFMQGVNQTINPFAGGGSNFGGNYWQQNAPYYDALGDRPQRGLGSFVQNWAAPAAASWASYKAFGEMSGRIGGAVGQGMGASLFSGSAGVEGISRAAKWGRNAGSMIGKAAIPWAIAQAGVDAFDNLAMDPFIGQSQSRTALRDNFSGVAFGGGGSNFTKGGLSRSTAAGIASGISQSASRDMTFNQKETSLLTDYASRAGLMDASNTHQMSAKFEQILKQVKVVMSVANTSDFKETIEIMSKMQGGGVAGHQLTGLMGQLAGSASMAGMSVQKLMNTTGASGQYMFGAAGLTPYLGQVTAFNAAGVLGASQRNGGISTGALGRMGGIEGATQSAVAGSLASYTTPYASMTAHNAYFGGGSKGSVVGNMSAFGASMAGNPMQNLGKFNLNRDALNSAHSRDRGDMGEVQQIHEIARTAHLLNKEGNVDQGTAFMIMTNYMGMTEQSARALLYKFAAYTDEGARKQMHAGLDKASMELTMNYKSQEGLDWGPLTGLKQGVQGGWQGMQEQSAYGIGKISTKIGRAVDDFEEMWTGAKFNMSEKNARGLSVDDVNGRATSTKRFNIKGAKRTSILSLKANMDEGSHMSELEEVQELADRGNATARLAINSTGVERRNAIRALSADGLIDKKYAKDSAELNAIVSLAGTVPTEDVASGSYGGDLTKLIKDDFDKIMGGDNYENKISYANLITKAEQSIAKGEKTTAAQREAIAKVGLDGKGNALSAENVGDDFILKEAEKVRKVMATGAYFYEGKTVEEIEAHAKKTGIAKGAAVAISRDPKATQAQIEVQKGITSRRAQINEMVKNHMISPNTGLEATTALDNGEAIGNFGSHVNKFGEIIAGMNGGKGGQPSYEGSNAARVVSSIVGAFK